jgi:hypothetical protein
MKAAAFLPRCFPAVFGPRSSPIALSASVALWSLRSGLQWSAVLVLFVRVGSALAQGVVVPAEHVAAVRAEATAASALHIVNELSNRRRLTTFFANEQSPFYGVQVNYVNVGRGNLTFLNGLSPILTDG